MSQNKDIITKACDVEGEALSGKQISEIVHKYEAIEDNQLVSQVLNPDNTGDFTLKYISEHEEFITLEEGHKIRICHNLTVQTNTSPITHNKLVIFIHGLGGSLEQFLPLMKLTDLSNKQFLAIDLMGFGQSDEFDEYPMLNIVKQVYDIVNNIVSSHLHNIILVGHSMGCYINLHLLTYYIKEWHISKLILLAPPAPTVTNLAKENRLAQWTLKFLYRVPWLVTFYREWFDQSKGLNSSGIQNFFHQANPQDDNDKENIRLRYLKLVQYYNNVQIKSRSLLGYLLGWIPLDWDQINSNMDQYNTKVIIISGESDQVTDVNCAKDVQNSFINTNENHVELITIAQCAHNITFDSTMKLCEIFIEKVI